MSLVTEHVENQKHRNLTHTNEVICQNRYQRDFFREYLDYQQEHGLPNKASSFKKFMAHWEALGNQVPYTKKYIKEKMLVLLNAISHGREEVKES